MSFLRCRIDKVLYVSGAYRVLLVRVFESDRVVRTTVASGNFLGIPNLIPGITFELLGEWGRHPRHGFQFKVKTWQPWGKNALDAQFFLANCTGIFDDPKLLQKAVQCKGTEIFNALADAQISEITENEGEKRALSEACSRWKALRNVVALDAFLEKCGLGRLASEVIEKFGSDSVSIVKQDPFRLMEVSGATFNQVDALAFRRGIGAGDPRRIKGGILWAIREETQQGHLFVRRGDIPSLMTELARRSGVAGFGNGDLSQAVANALVELDSNRAVVVDPGVGVYNFDTYLYEREAAVKLAEFLVPSELIIDLDIFLRNYEEADNITLSDMQRKAIEKLIANRVLVVAGAPGTGKTTLIRAFVHLFRQLKVSHILMASTGIAAKRLASVTGVEAQTVHRALKYDGFKWGHNREDLLDTQAVIVDEFSMLDQEVFYRLLDALSPRTMLTLVGDDAQLPSVGPGNVLRELLACDAVSHVRLEQVFRQAETSDIVLAAHRIRVGKSPLDLPKKEGTEFRFVSTADEELIAKLIVGMAVKLKDRNENFQVLSPKYEGIVGVNNLNELLRNELNPDKGQECYDLADFEVRIGDRLMVIKNDYRLNVYNGDIGKLVDIKRDALTLKIYGTGQIPDVLVNISKENADYMLKLAYAVTVHRCQGEEFATVILPLVRSQGRMLQRNLFYTAITRARKKVWLVGEIDAVLKAVANDKVVQRNTILHSLIKPGKN